MTKVFEAFGTPTTNEDAERHDVTITVASGTGSAVVSFDEDFSAEPNTYFGVDGDANVYYTARGTSQMTVEVAAGADADYTVDVLVVGER